MKRTTFLKQVKRSLGIGVLSLLQAVSAFAHGGEETTTGWNGFMDGWSHWGMAGGWMWIFPALIMAFFIVGIVSLVKANRTPPASAVTTQQDNAANKE